MVVFLDFDGVLHGVSRPAFNEESMKHLEACLEIHGASIVIISSWKDELPLDELVRRLGSLGHRVIGKCNEEPAFTKVPRESLVDAWLADQEYAGPWLAVDDHPQWYGRHAVQVYATASKTGFTEDDVAAFHALARTVQSPSNG